MLSRPQNLRLSADDFAAIRRTLQTGGAFELDLTNLNGIPAEPGDARIPRLTSAPDPYTAPYDTYVLVGPPDTIWQIDRSTNPPTAVEIASTPSNMMTTDTDQTPDATVVKTWTAVQEFDGGLTAGDDIHMSAGQFKSDDQGLVFAFRNSAQSITDSVQTGINLTSENYDRGTWHDNATNPSRLTVPTDYDGVCVFNGWVRFAANATGYRQVRIILNGATVLASATVASIGAGASTEVPISVHVDLAAGDYVELVVFQDSGGALDVSYAQLIGSLLH